MRGRAGSRCGAGGLAALTIGLSLLLSSCVKPTVFPRYLTVADVINNVKCELFMAIETGPKADWLNHEWTAAFTIVLQVFRSGGGSGDLDLVVPHSLGTGTIGFSAGLVKTGQSRITINFNAEKNLAAFRKSTPKPCDYTPDLTYGRNLAGDTGLRLWFGQLIDGVNRADINKQSTGFVYSLEFVTTVEGRIRPAFRNAYSDGRIFSGTFNLRRERKDTNTLTVTFAKAAPAFSATPLGEQLARIEALLRQEREKKREALADLKAAKKKEADENKRIELFASEGRSAVDIEGAREAARAAEAKVEAAQSKLDSADAQITVLEEVKRAAASAAPVAAVPAQQQINQLLLLDAIRDIARQ